MILVLSALPLLRVLAEALGGISAFSPTAWAALVRSVVTSVGGAAIALILSVPFALAVALTNVPAQTLLSGCALLGLLIPGQIVALAWMQALGNTQFLYSPLGIILLLGVEHMPIGFISSLAPLRAIPAEVIEAARMDGASPLRIAWRIVLPLGRPGIVTGFTLAFLSCLGSFGVPAMLGIPARYLTLPVLIYQRLSGIGIDVLPQAAALALPLMLLAGITAVLASRALRQEQTGTEGTGAFAAVDLGRWKKPVAGALMMIAALVLLVPLVSLVMTSVTTAYGVALRPATFTLAHYATILGTDEAAHAFLTSLWLAGCTALIAGAGAFVIAVLRWWDGKTLSVLEPLIQAPFALPGTIFAIGMILLYLRPLPLIGSLYGTPWIILLAYIPRFLPLALGPLRGAVARLDPAIDEAARVDGTSLWPRLRRVALPLVAPAVISGALLVALTAFGELTVSALLWSPGSETVGVLIFGLNEGGDVAGAAAASVLCLVLVFALAWMMRMAGGLVRATINRR